LPLLTEMLGFPLLDSSIFLGWFKVQWHTLSRWLANVKIKVRLLMAFGVLLAPQIQQKWRKLTKDKLRPVSWSACGLRMPSLRAKTRAASL